MTGSPELEEQYFDWLRHDCFTASSERREYEGVLRVLHDIPFYWDIWSDENRAGDAITFRQADFLEMHSDLDHLDQAWLASWAQATPSVLEVLLGCARRWSVYFEGEVAYYFGHMFINLDLEKHPGRHLDVSRSHAIRSRLDDWMNHRYPRNGHGTPFPLKHHRWEVPLSTVDIWMQMNAYSLEHFQ